MVDISEEARSFKVVEENGQLKGLVPKLRIWTSEVSMNIITDQKGMEHYSGGIVQLDSILSLVEARLVWSRLILLVWVLCFRFLQLFRLLIDPRLKR